MAGTRAGVATLQLAGALGIAHLGPARHVAEHLLSVTTGQLHGSLGHAIVTRVTTVYTTDPDMEDDINNILIVMILTASICDHKTWSSHT